MKTHFSLASSWHGLLEKNFPEKRGPFWSLRGALPPSTLWPRFTAFTLSF